LVCISVEKSKNTPSLVSFDSIPLPSSQTSFAALEEISRGAKFPKEGYFLSK
jgi:hypothetical protein